MLLLHLKVPKYHCTGCNLCYRYCYSGIRPRYRANNVYLLNVFEAHDGGATQNYMQIWKQYDPQGRKNRELISLMRVASLQAC